MTSIDITIIILATFLAAYLLGAYRGYSNGYSNGYKKGRQELDADRIAKLKEKGLIDEDGRILLSGD